MFSEKDLDQTKKILKKNNKQKPQLNRVIRPEEGALSACDDSRTQQGEERLLFFPGKDSVNEKAWTLFYYGPLNFFFFSVKAFSFPCCVEPCMWLALHVADPKLHFSANPE